MKRRRARWACGQIPERSGRAVNRVAAYLLHVPGWTVLLVVGLIVFGEDALFVGFVVPGETAALLGGVAAKLGHVPLWAVLTTVIAAAVAGDSVGYSIGRRLGRSILRLRVLNRRRESLQRAERTLARRGAGAVVLGRWVAFLRSAMPTLAGAARMPYRRFLIANAAGGVTWAAVVVLVGYAVGASFAAAERTLGRDVGLAVAVVAVVALAVVGIHRRIRPPGDGVSR